uniref:Uncharacterized protein n=1 Tax=Salix viminalis TaxID=40686 RepID=A0A6N2NLX2_SALVM
MEGIFDNYSMKLLYFGDGTTSTVIFIGELLKQSEHCQKSYSPFS